MPLVPKPITDGKPSTTTNLTKALLERLLSMGVIAADVWDKLSPADIRELDECPDLNVLAEMLLSLRVVTQFQAGRIRVSNINGLVLGNYRILEKIGSGGMGIVFRAEHLKLKNPVAVKALYVDGQKNRRHIERFFLEVRAIATLKHPNIVTAIDAGEEPHAGPDGQPVPYFVMEYVPGRNLDDLISQEGPLSITRGCQLAHQIADALTESHRQGLIHRDIKPSNIIYTPEGKAKLLDFGVARLPSPEKRLTQDGARLGTVGYMSPEQARNPRDVDARADVFGLAATLFFTLSGHDPFQPPGGALTAQRPPRLSEYRVDTPVGLDEVLARMMALDPSQRTPSAGAAMRELAPFLGYETPARLPPLPAPAKTPPPVDTKGLPNPLPPVPKQPQQPLSARMPIVSDAILNTTATLKKAEPTHRILIVDDEEPVRRVCRLALQHESMQCEEVMAGNQAVARGTTEPFDLVLLDIDLPELNGELVLRKLRQQPTLPNQKIIMLSGRTSGDDLSRLLGIGADDYLTKPFSVVQLRSRVKAALRLKDAQDRSDHLAKQLATSNTQLESALRAKASELVHARGAIVLALARLVEQRSSETGSHLMRLQRYCRVLAEAAALTPAFKNSFDPELMELIEAAAPLHDIGKVAVPDHVLNKSSKLTAEERVQIQSHTIIGAQTLAEVAARYPLAAGFFEVAIMMARSHHERWDGSGYPDGLAGNAIPLVARLLTICDVYDALRCRRNYKAAIPHAQTVELMLSRSSGHFDPALMEVFSLMNHQFERIYNEASD